MVCLKFLQIYSLAQEQVQELIHLLTSYFILFQLFLLA